MSRYLLRALITAVLFFLISVDVRYGDSRYDVDGWTLRHWSLVPTSVEFKPACALVRSGGNPCGSSGATTYTLTGPASGRVNAATTNYTVQANGATTVAVTPNDSTHGGVFSPTSVSLANTNPVTFTYTPLQTGTFNIATTNGGALSNPTAISFNVPNAANGYPGLAGGTYASNNGSTFTTGGAGDPFGGANTATLTEDTSNNYHSAIAQANISINSTAETLSIMLHAGSGSRDLYIQLIDGGTFGANAITMTVQTSTCSILSTGTFGSSVVNSSTTRTTNLGSGWCLAQVSGTPNFSTALIQFFLQNAGNILYTGDGTSSIELYGPVVQ